MLEVSEDRHGLPFSLSSIGTPSNIMCFASSACRVAFLVLHSSFRLSPWFIGNSRSQS